MVPTRQTKEVTHKKNLHGESSRSVGMKSTTGKAQKSVNGTRPILYPLTPTHTDHRVLSAAVDLVVGEQKK